VGIQSVLEALLYPVIGDDLIGSFLDGVDGRESCVGLAVGLEAGASNWRAPGVGGDVIQVQVLFTGHVLLLQGLKQHVWVVPDLPTSQNITIGLNLMLKENHTLF